MVEFICATEDSTIIDERDKIALIVIVSNAVELIHSGGYLIFDHWTSLTHKAMDWFPWELFCDLVPNEEEFDSVINIFNEFWFL